MNKFKQAEYRQNQISTYFDPCPSDQYTRVYITGELASAENFPEAEIFISYHIEIPIGWRQELPDDYQSIELSKQQIEELNCLKSITQSCSPILEKKDNGSIKTRFFFCFPIDIQLMMRNTATEWPIIHFEVFSKDKWQRIQMHGCGYVTVPCQPGYHELEVQTWKPNVDLKTKISQFFLGGLIRTKNLQEISKSEKMNELDQPGPINRYMFNTISSGSLNINLNVAIQSKSIRDKQRGSFKAQKFSEQTELKKLELGQTIPSFVNTGSILGGRFTHTNL